MEANDERLMEHTEKVVADMLKYVLAPSDLQTDDSVEFVIIDETSVTKANAATDLEATDERAYTFDLPGLKISSPSSDNAFNEVLSDIEIFLAQGLDKIRTEYPMYAESMNPYLCNNCFSSALQAPSSGGGGYNFLTNEQAPMNNNNNWFNGGHHNAGSGGFGSTFGGHTYHTNHVTRTPICNGELWNDEDEWPVVGNLPKRNKRVANEPNADIGKDINEEDEASSEQEDEEADEISNSSAAQQPHQEDVLTTNQQQYSEYSATNNVPAATTAANPFQLSQTALHQTHSTTTTTTAFGVVHQQTSSTTTNFVSNNLANAALATTPAALYTQALLAQQYWSTILKDAQQRQNINLQAQTTTNSNTSNNNTNNTTHNHNNNININAAIYERFAYAHLLQQQIIQQQQQAAIAALLQQQKIALQNNLAAAAVAQATNTNLFAVGSSNPPNGYANFDYGRMTNVSTTPTQPPSTAQMSATATATMNINMQMNANLLAEATHNSINNSNNNSNVASSHSSNNCTPTNSNVSLDLLNLNEEHQISCSGIVSKVSQSSRD